MQWSEGATDICAVLLVYMSAPDAFIAVSNLFAKSRLLSGLQARDPEVVAAYFSAFEVKLAKYCPKACSRLWEAGVSADSYLTPWISSLFARCLSLETLW